MTGVHWPVLWLLGARLMQVSLVNIVVFGTYVETVRLLLWEFHRVHSDHRLVVVLGVLRSHGLVEHVEVDFGVVELTKVPLTDFTIV